MAAVNKPELHATREEADAHVNSWLLSVMRKWREEIPDVYTLNALHPSVVDPRLEGRTACVWGRDGMRLLAMAVVVRNNAGKYLSMTREFQ